MDAKCYKCGRPLKQYSPLRGKRCGKCEYMSRKEKIIANMAAWRANNRDRAREGGSRRYAARKLASIDAYGGKCMKCDEKSLHFLTIDHINDNGAQDRAARKNKVSDVHTWLKQNGYPSGYQVLCGNCNLQKEIERRRSVSGPSWEKSQGAKTRVIARYGNKCVCCCEKDMDKLTIDHVMGGGSKAKSSYPSRNVYFFLDKKPVDRKQFQVMCQNCNQAKASFGQCPGHQMTRS